ncbi:MAG: hypothetical protein LBV34_14515 [Nocardiopsaceae bacterium]|nr:hypothetical protein [Nocardiopsaceae bacterium]
MSAVLIVATAAAVPAAQADAVTARPTPAAVLSGTGVLNDVVAISATNAWAVGHFGDLSHPKTLIEHWNGRAWRRISVTPAAGWLNGVAATSARDVWVVGFSHSRALILHFNGAVWRRVASPSPGTALTLLSDVTVISPDNVWAAGITGGTKTLIEHWNGTRWRRVPSPSPLTLSLLSGISAASANDVWAVGGNFNNKMLILHWNGTRWRHVASPKLGSGGTLESVTAFSAKNAWAVGETGRGTLILHWNGTAWRRVRSPAIAAGAGLIGISGTSARNLWAVGATGSLLAGSAGQPGLAPSATRAGLPARASRRAPASEPLILHWNGTAWRRVSVPKPANGGMLIGVDGRSSRKTWAVGDTKTFANIKARPLALRWNGTAWK